MTMPIRLAPLGLLALLLVGAGCGGHGSNSSSSSSTRGRLKFTVKWPESGRFIAKQANKVIVTVTGPDPVTPTRLVFYRTPHPGQVLGSTQTTGELLEGSYTVTAASYADASTGTSTGTDVAPLSQNTNANVPVTAGTTSSTNVVLEPTFKKLHVTVTTKPATPVPIKDFDVFANDPSPDVTTALPLTGNYLMTLTPRTDDDKDLILFDSPSADASTDLQISSSPASKLKVVVAGDDATSTAMAKKSVTLQALANSTDPVTVKIKYQDNVFSTDGSKSITFNLPFTIGPVGP